MNKDYKLEGDIIYVDNKPFCKAYPFNGLSSQESARKLVDSMNKAEDYKLEAEKRRLAMIGIEAEIQKCEEDIDEVKLWN